MTDQQNEDKLPLDKLVLAIDDVNYVYEQYKYADWSYLRDNKSHLLEKCSTSRKVFSAYLGDAPTLKGYLSTIDHIEGDLKKL